MRAVRPAGKAGDGSEGVSDLLIRRERDVLQVLEKLGMKEDAELCHERLKIMTT